MPRSSLPFVRAGGGAQRRAAESPSAGQRMQAGVEGDLARHRVVMPNEAAAVIARNLGGNACEEPERALKALEATRLPLIAEAPHVQTPRIAQRRQRTGTPSSERRRSHPAFA